MIHMQFSTFYLILVQSQPLDACSSSAGLRLFSFVPESSNRILKMVGKKKEIISLKKTHGVCAYISKFPQNPVSLNKVLRRLKLLS